LSAEIVSLLGVGMNKVKPQIRKDRI